MTTQTSLLPDACPACGQSILWAINEHSGRRIALDTEQTPPRPMVAAYNPRTGRYRTLLQADLPSTWRRGGVTVHAHHWSTCTHQERWNATTGQPA